MLTMKVAITFFICSVLSCIFFTLGRFVEKADEADAKKIIRDKNINKKEIHKDHKTVVIDVEYEDGSGQSCGSLSA